jgi:hypothetical protein
LCGISLDEATNIKRVTPSEVDATRLKQEPVKVEEQVFGNVKFCAV